MRGEMFRGDADPGIAHDDASVARLAFNPERGSFPPGRRELDRVVHQAGDEPAELRLVAHDLAREQTPPP